MWIPSWFAAEPAPIIHDVAPKAMFSEQDVKAIFIQTVATISAISSMIIAYYLFRLLHKMGGWIGTSLHYGCGWFFLLSKGTLLFLSHLGTMMMAAVSLGFLVCGIFIYKNISLTTLQTLLHSYKDIFGWIFQQLVLPAMRNFSPTGAPA